MIDDGPACACCVVPPARRSVGAACEVVLAGMITLASCVGAVILFIRMYGLVGVAAWLVVFAAWAYAATRYRLTEWCPSDGIAGLVLVGGFAAQAGLNAHWNHVGDVVFVVAHAAAITGAIRTSPFPRARARSRGRATRNSCSTG